jgi:hypothetical protein
MTTINELQSEISLLKAAREKILTGGQSYTISGRTFLRGDLKILSDEIRLLEMRLAMASGASPLQSSIVEFGVRA